MGRPHIEFIQGLDVSERAVNDGPFEGAHQRLLSEDDVTAAYSALVRFPAGWRGELVDFPRPIELLGLRGRLQLGGHALEPGGYAFVPGGGSRLIISATRQSLVFLMVDEEREGGNEELAVIDTNAMKWENFDHPEIAAGLVRKVLRIDPDRADWTYLVGCVAAWHDERSERHPTIQEGFMVSGDLLLGEHGVMKPGGYFWRPPMGPHGPIVTRGGCVFLLRTKDGGWDITYDEVPRWEQMLAGYMEAEPYF